MSKNIDMNLPERNERHKLFGSVEPGPSTKPHEKEKMADIQNERQEFVFDIESVAITEATSPITIKSTLKPTTQTSMATFNITSNNDKDSKRTNMSRFLDQLNIYEHIGLKADFKTMFNVSRDV